MTKNRINELQNTTPWPRVSYRRLSRQYRSYDSQNGINDGTAQLTTIDMDNDHNVAEFLAQIDLIRLLIDKIEELAKDIAEIHKKMLEPMPDPRLGQVLDEKTADIKKLAYDIATKLKKMEYIQADENKSEKADAQWRIKESQIFNMTRRFRDVMNQYNLECVLHRGRCKKVIMRQLEITGNRKSDDELEEMLETGSPIPDICVIVDIEKARQAATEINARHQDITKLETSVRELHDMFVELAILVTTQGEMVDNIQYNVTNAKENVEEATDQIEKTNTSQKSTRKRNFWICVILIAIILIFILIFGSYIIIQKKIIGK